MKTEVLVTGTFNVLHAGHIRLLEFASRYGLVTVGLNCDSYLINKYGEKTVPLVDRSYVLRSNCFVQKVVVFMEDNPSALIRKLKPKYYVRGPDYKDVVLPERAALDQVRCKLLIHQERKEYNSSELIETLELSAFQKMKKYI